MKKLMLSVVLACSCVSGAYCMDTDGMDGQAIPNMEQEKQRIITAMQRDKDIQNWIGYLKEQAQEDIDEGS
ncbi:MAG: hypothetical protein LBG13_02530, partial [Holosporales bacterium]|nr:hypothetical protein [Holosporales bacterium]